MVSWRSKEKRTKKEGAGFIAAEVWGRFCEIMGGKPDWSGLFNEKELRKYRQCVRQFCYHRRKARKLYCSWWETLRSWESIFYFILLFIYGTRDIMFIC